MCSRFSSCSHEWQAASTASAVSLLSSPPSSITLCPMASIAPASCTLTCPESAATTPCHGARRASITTALACVPPARKLTSASGAPAASRMRARARSLWASAP